MRLASTEVKALLARGARLRADGASSPAHAEVGLQGRMLTSDGPHGRIALAAPKRLLKRAIDRNRVKRVLREAFRQTPALRAAPVDLLITLTSVGTRRTDTSSGKAKTAKRRLPMGARALKQASRSAAELLIRRALSRISVNAEAVRPQATPLLEEP
jgi:ribonuclease P protein component